MAMHLPYKTFNWKIIYGLACLKEMLTSRKHKKQDASGQPTSRHDGIFAFGVADFINDYTIAADKLLESARLRSHERGKISLKIAADLHDEKLLAVLEPKKVAEMPQKIGKCTVNGVKRRYSLYEIETR